MATKISLFQILLIFLLSEIMCSDLGCIQWIQSLEMLGRYASVARQNLPSKCLADTSFRLQITNESHVEAPQLASTACFWKVNVFQNVTKR